MNNTVGTILTAIVVPVGWGLVSAWLFDRCRAWRRQARERRDDRSPEVAR